MRRIEAEVDVEAEPGWAALADFAANPRWNPFMPGVYGETLSLKLQVRSSSIGFSARERAGGLRADDCVELRPEEEHSGRNVEAGHHDDHRGQTSER